MRKYKLKYMLEFNIDSYRRNVLLQTLIYLMRLFLIGEKLRDGSRSVEFVVLHMCGYRIRRIKSTGPVRNF